MAEGHFMGYRGSGGKVELLIKGSAYELMK